MSFKYGVIITGMIASGKSSVCNLLLKRGYEIVCADKISHKILDDNATLIAKNFGFCFVNENKVDRKALGNLVFSDKDAKTRLENLLHPLIHKEIYKQAKILEKKEKLYFVDIPLFFETGKKYEFNKILLVYAPKDLCLQRLLKRDNISKKQALYRINSQLDIEKKKKMCDLVLENTSDLVQLERNLERILQNLQR